ncbi:hypothetical protein NOS3756_41040 [Nostoc sp. NIES-3756]|uniref:helix-turn-helix domain-containing protein n=1 Tax=Nostoc sp. NIES-3756 TaxID=1751286 RepID=UPI00071F5EB9|nr:helix-turn-helix domain-containing protein [Nostoc sp. NIES-3756]BAT55126.1 hypothetical protein NOS3756_41040 [Nostoc sp. NIES-3756]
MDANKQSAYLTVFQQKLLFKLLQEFNLSHIYRRRLEIMLLADEGKSQIEIAKHLNCARETVRHWMSVAITGQAHCWQLSPLGRPKTINDQYLQRLQELVITDPQIFGYSLRRWTAPQLSKHLTQELGIEISARHINRLLKNLGLSTRRTSQKHHLVIDNISDLENVIPDLLPISELWKIR